MYTYKSCGMHDHFSHYRENLPGHFKFKEYCPRVFRDLRKRFVMDDIEYMVWVCVVAIVDLHMYMYTHLYTSLCRPHWLSSHLAQRRIQAGVEPSFLWAMIAGLSLSPSQVRRLLFFIRSCSRIMQWVFVSMHVYFNCANQLLHTCMYVHTVHGLYVSKRNFLQSFHSNSAIYIHNKMEQKSTHQRQLNKCTRVTCVWHACNMRVHVV